MSELELPSVDVVIPVYNAPELTKCCIESVVTCLHQSIQHILIQDDASDMETKEILEHLPYPQLSVYHAEKNQGFGATVNDAVARSDADFVLVLNSDTEVDKDFLPLLCAAFVADPQLAVISPASRGSIRYDSDRYMRRPGGHIQAFRFQGYAFLIRRKVFMEMGGFDPEFGRGYFEDTDLGRRLIQRGWCIGVHPDAYIHHKGGGSFGRGRAYRVLMQRNRDYYLSRYPEAHNNVLLISACHTLTDLPVDLRSEIECVFEKGGNVHWLTPVSVPKLFCLQMRNSSISLITIVRLMLRGLLRVDKRVTTIWILPDTPFFLRALLVFFTPIRKLKIRRWALLQH